ncbi:cystathionine beta-lyase [Alcaligenaceae bacterium]|nr:cystathionine beta-lyase [Alcaligenaceae bacterium]
MQTNTRLVWAGRHPERHGGLVNTPICRGSTLLAGSLEEWRQKKARHAGGDLRAGIYGRFGTPTHHALQEAMEELEGGHRSLLYSSGLAACANVLTGLLSAGDHVLYTDSVYSPTRQVLTSTLARFGVESTAYDPRAAEGIEALIRPNTRVVYVESPGSETFEIQDIPAIAEVAHRHGAWVVMDNTWATPLYFRAMDHGVDVSIQAATKYITGHSDALLGVATCTRDAWPHIARAYEEFGQTAGPDEAYLALRGLRSLKLRLDQHWSSGLRVAQWLEARPEVEAVLHPALPSHPGHALWKRDFRGACGLFSIALKPLSEEALAAFFDSLRLFGLGLSWGGYESLAVPFETQRQAARWPYEGPGVRIHVGLEDPEDLIADLGQAFRAMAAANEPALSA